MATKKTTSKKTTTKKTPAKKAPARKASAKKPPAKKSTTAKTPSGKKTPTRKPSRKPSTKRAATKQPDAKPQKARKRSKLSGLDMAAIVLAEAGEPLGTKEITTRVIAKGWKTRGKTPAATLYAAMLREIADRGSDSRFAKTGRGEFEATDKAGS
ncbi:MAG: HTH domain-containing protein [Phycisphaerales bacterium]